MILGSGWRGKVIAGHKARQEGGYRMQVPVPMRWAAQGRLREPQGMGAPWPG